jgi:hypothetical protein
VLLVFYVTIVFFLSFFFLYQAYIYTVDIECLLQEMEEIILIPVLVHVYGMLIKSSILFLYPR